MYWKAMAIPDSLIVRYLELVTDASPAEVRGARQALAEGANPRDVKKDLARRLVAQFHGEVAARSAEDEFLKTRAVPEITVPRGRQNLADLFVTAGLGTSKSEIRRLVEQKGLFLDDEPVTSTDAAIEPRTGMVLRRGKHLAVRLRVA
jgi:tyrosyl-tRNA synthetase